MNRRGFLKRFGIGVATAVVAPKVLLEEDKPIPLLTSKEKQIPSFGKGGGLRATIADSPREHVLYTGKLGMEEFNRVLNEMFGA